MAIIAAEAVISLNTVCYLQQISRSWTVIWQYGKLLNINFLKGHIRKNMNKSTSSFIFKFPWSCRTAFGDPHPWTTPVTLAPLQRCWTTSTRKRRARGRRRRCRGWMAASWGSLCRPTPTASTWARSTSPTPSERVASGARIYLINVLSIEWSGFCLVSCVINSRVPLPDRCMHPF